MRAAVVPLICCAVGFLLGYMAFGGGDGPPSVRASRDEARAAGDLEVPPRAEPAAHAAEGEAAEVDRVRLDAERRVGTLWTEIRKRSNRILDLERELDALRRTLPRPEILRALDRASVEELEGVGEAVSRVASEKLLAVPEAVARLHAQLLSRPEAGAARILPRGRFDRLVSLRGGGAYFSFATRSHSYDAEPDLELQQGYYETAFYGDTCGFLLDAGELPLDGVGGDERSPPPAVSAEAWAFLWSEIPSDRQERQDWRRRGAELRLGDRVKAEPRHAYVLRAVLPGEHDILVAFRDEHRDDHGHTLIWRELRRWAVPPR